MNTKKLTKLSLLLASALILSYIETLIPFDFTIPGIKIGLANIAIMYTFYKVGIKESYLVSLVRVLVMAILFYSFVAAIYSFVGALLSLIVMSILERFKVFDIKGTCICGAISHNIGQILAACVLLGTSAIFYYLPFLLLSGLLSGLMIGIFTSVLIKRIK